jgi:hypothetical protein
MRTYWVVLVVFVINIVGWAYLVFKKQSEIEAQISDWEKRTGNTFPREGSVKKGGQNLPPITKRPQPPKSQTVP